LSKGFFITTMGCQMNEYDSDYLAQSLINLGYFSAADPETADIIFINTCTVRAKPEQKAQSLLGRMLAMKKKKPHLIVAVMGCLAQQEGAALMTRFPLLDMVVGPRELAQIPEYVKEITLHRERIVATGLEAELPRMIVCPGYSNTKVTAFIPVMQGCNNFCSYCVVPFVRGREVCRHPEEILREAEHLISQGVKEITLIGQNVNSYRWEDTRKWGFIDLLHLLSRTKGLLRLRFTTSHPKDLSDDLIASFREIPILCPHVHLPFQAGSNKILKRMRRGYTRETYLNLVHKLREVRPDIAITSDVMVGFPGESEEDFESTLDLMNKVEFDGLFSFKYSDRKGTLAEKLSEKVNEQEKAARLTALQALQKKITLRKNRRLEGREFAILVEGQSKRGSQFTGRTDTNKIVNFNSKNLILGNIVKVTIKHAHLNSLLGEL
jgi:tRNA-2-methylthio-N6-dimethylallyladenosine synthase